MPNSPQWPGWNQAAKPIKFGLPPLRPRTPAAWGPKLKISRTEHQNTKNTNHFIPFVARKNKFADNISLYVQDFPNQLHKRWPSGYYLPHSF